MKSHEFYQTYANTPLGDRDKPFRVGQVATTLQKIYKELKQIEDKIRPEVIRKEKLLTMAEKYIIWKTHKQ